MRRSDMQEDVCCLAEAQVKVLAKAEPRLRETVG
jgi:hypothetical protein